MKNQCGIIHFIDAEKSQKAFASIAGEESFQIESLSQLDTQTRWMTNLSTGLPNQPKQVNHALFLQNNYLRLTTDQILNLLHVTGEKYDIQTQIAFLSRVFSNVVALGEVLLHIERLPAFEYRKGIRRSLMEFDQKQPEIVRKMILDSTQYYTFSLEKTDPDKRVTFLLPKFSHAKKILGTVLPAGDWKKVDLIPDHTEQIPEWLKSRKTPFFAKVVLSNFDSELHTLINFGSSVPEGSERQWVTNVELEMLLGVADISIKEVWESSDTLKPFNVIEKLRLIGDSGDVGTSLGILAENIWTGLALNMPPSIAKKNKALAKKHVNTVAPFLIAADRKLCFEKARAFRKLDFSVASYGYGKITVDASFQEEKDIVEAALTLGVVPPHCPNLNIELDPDSDNYLDFLQAFHATGDTKKLLIFDNRFTDKILAGDIKQWQQ